MTVHQRGEESAGKALTHGHDCMHALKMWRVAVKMAGALPEVIEMRPLIAVAVKRHPNMPREVSHRLGLIDSTLLACCFVGMNAFRTF
jgi:hypothetical protein